MYLTPTQIALVYATMRAKAPQLYKLYCMEHSPELPIKRLSLMLAHSDIKGIVITHKDANNCTQYYPIFFDKNQLKKERLSHHIKASALGADVSALFSKREGSDQGIIVYVSQTKNDDEEQHELRLHNIYCCAADVEHAYGVTMKYQDVFEECQMSDGLQ